MRPVIGMVILLLFTQFGYSQKKWTLSECIDYSLQNNLELKDFYYSEASNKENLKQSYRDFLPQINGVLDGSKAFGRSVNPADNSFVNNNFFSSNYRIEASVDLFQGLKRLKTIESGKLLLEASMNDGMHYKYMLAFDLMSAYLDVLYFEELIVIQQEQLSIAQDNYDLIEKKIELGLMAGADLFEAQSTLLADSLSYIQSVNSSQEAQLNLLNKMNLPANEFIKLDPTSIDEFIFSNKDLSNLSLTTIHNKALSFIPDIKSSELQVLAARKNIEIARSDLYPSATVFGGYSTGFYETFVNGEGKTVPFFNQLDGNSKQLIGVSLNIPIFSKGTTHSKIELSKIETLRQENVLNQKKQALKEIIQGLMLEQKALEKEASVSSNNIKAQNLTFFTAQKKYENGLINILAFHQAKTAYSQALTENLLIKFNGIVTKSTLGFYYGLPTFKNLIKN